MGEGLLVGSMGEGLLVLSDMVFLLDDHSLIGLEAVLD
jgi:hypothetical protein